MATNYQQEELWRKDAKNWKLGLFYYNKEDQRIIVEKRNPAFGITFNFAHGKTYFYLIGMFLFFGFVVYMITNFKK
ncbi:hypothetical protein [Flavobacterium capsici]|uniref:DUF5808 domain-containing protein n=1 Tax=Flavobacterium capsici TaxID=3075618 RepID=A0AA96F0D4_9FLAO|nr:MULTISPECIES: hypothetical protein [unclassified Flavobacterium]WNM20275.1 hypothetical protein RN608_06235 [Flavobacterium sp. PMR2A8]WNM21665.1 hypothetical protein RN605_13405 [Flavobacterium sp. PMTSA4]